MKTTAKGLEQQPTETVSGQSRWAPSLLGLWPHTEEGYKHTYALGGAQQAQSTDLKWEQTQWQEQSRRCQSHNEVWDKMNELIFWFINLAARDPGSILDLNSAGVQRY